MKKVSTVDKCVLKQDVQDAVDFVNGVKTILVYVTTVAFIALVAFGVYKGGSSWNNLMREEGRNKLLHKARMCQHENVSEEDLIEIWKEFPKDNNIDTLQRSRKLYSIEGNKIRKCLQELDI